MKIWVTIEFSDGTLRYVNRSHSEDMAIKVAVQIMKVTWPDFSNNKEKVYVEGLKEYGSIHSEISDSHIFVTELE